MKYSLDWTKHRLGPSAATRTHYRDIAKSKAPISK